jgi:hypothetical protein
VVFVGNGFAYSGEVLAINEDGSYQVQWKGFGRNDHWDANRALHEKPAENPVKVGERVWTTPDMWEDNRARQGKILRINADGTFRLSFADTDDATFAKEYLRREKPAPLPKKSAASSTASSSNKGGVEQCRQGPQWTNCPGIGCHNLKAEAANCGVCGNYCPPNRSMCNDGVCDCRQSEKDSDGHCTN